MSGAAAIDLRYPIGGLFVVLGALLAGYGAMTNGDAMYGRATGVNVNLWWGLVMLATGVLFLLLARRGTQAAAMRPAETTPEGRATERRERETGLEKSVRQD
jgi:TM2 domain-containing membrane protein YozV